MSVYLSVCLSVCPRTHIWNTRSKVYYLLHVTQSSSSGAVGHTLLLLSHVVLEDERYFPRHASLVVVTRGPPDRHPLTLQHADSKLK